MSEFHIRPIQSDQAEILLALKKVIWPAETHSLTQVRTGLAAQAQQTLVAWQGDRPVGFAATFPTLAATGTRRWELDLLGVHPAARGQRLGTQLVEASLRQLPRQSGEPVRALIATRNVASQTAFRRAGFLQLAAELALFSCDLRRGGRADLNQIPAHPVLVQTVNYSGYWLEEIQDVTALTLAARLPLAPAATQVGALLAVDRPELLLTARQAAYTHIGTYHWWTFREAAAGSQDKKRARPGQSALSQK